MENYFTQLYQINVSDHIEKKGQFAYLSWPYAVAQLRQFDPTASWEIKRFDGQPFCRSEVGYFVEVSVTVHGITLTQLHPVLDGKNRPIAEPSSFDINTSIQRCLVKAIALHGLGLYIYAGEDLPDAERNPEKPKRASNARQCDSAAGVYVCVESPDSLHRAVARTHRAGQAAPAGLLQRGAAGRPLGRHGEPSHQITREEREGRVMAAIVRIEQGSPQWQEHRRKHRNASETPAVLGVSPWQTPYQLWMLRTGKALPPPPTPAMTHGSRTEAIARVAYERQTGLVLQPLVLVDGEYSASLDGATLDGELVLEIKCPFKGRASALWVAAERGEIPEHYRWQLQHQLMVSRARRAHLFVYTEEQSLLLECEPVNDDWPTIQAGWDEFMQHVAAGTPPALSDRDCVERTDAEWTAAAEEFIRWHREVEAGEKNLAAAKRRLVELGTSPSQKGGGVSVSRFWKTGGVDYKRLIQESGLDAERYRQPAREEVRIVVSK